MSTHILITPHTSKKSHFPCISEWKLYHTDSNLRLKTTLHYQINLCFTYRTACVVPGWGVTRLIIYQSIYQSKIAWMSLWIMLQKRQSQRCSYTFNFSVILILNWNDKSWSGSGPILPSKPKGKEINTSMDYSLQKARTVNRMNSFFPDRWPFSYLNFVKIYKK